MTVSIIIAVKTWQKNLEKCVGKCLQLDFGDFEILILPDSTVDFPTEMQGLSPGNNVRDGGPSMIFGKTCIKIIPTGNVTPPKKRDIGLEHAKGEIIAFLDDDAYPPRDWLKNALEDFKDAEVAAVGGPAVTPSEDNKRQKASGKIYESALVSASFVYRYLPKQKHQINDYPTSNLLVRKSILQQIGGFNTNFWPGEDTKLCLDITKGLGKKIIYDPGVLIYHHRRQVFLPHLKQIANYGLHRGYFVKRYPDTSFKIAYFIPSLFTLGLAAGFILSIFFIFVRLIYICSTILYILMVFLVTLTQKNKDIRYQDKGLSLDALVFCGTIVTHITYGIYFLKGLFSKELKEEISLKI